MPNTPRPNSPRAIIYTRVSTEEQASEGHSLEAQARICRAFADQRGWSVVALYEDAGISGKNDRRKGFQAVLADVRQGRADIVVTHKLDRFSRSIIDILVYMRELSKLGVSYASATEQFDFTTPMGKVVLTILAAFAEWYLDNLSAETKKGKKERAQKGLWNGNPPFGYRVNPDTKRLEIEPHEAEGVRMAFREYAAGHRTDIQIARLLNAADYRTFARKPMPFSKDTVREMLKNVFYLGLVKYKDQTYTGQHPAIIDRALFDKAMIARRANTLRHNSANHTATRIYPLAGIVHCRECGRKLRGQFWGKHGRHYHDPAHEYDDPCTQPANIPAELLETDIANVIGAITLPPNWQKRIIARLKSKRDPRVDERKRAGLRGQLARARQLFVLGDMSEREYNLEKTRVQSEIDQLQPVPELDLLKAGEMLADFSNVWKSANAEQKKRLLQAMLERVYVLGDRVMGIQPKLEFYPIFLTGCGPDGIRTRDLGLDRAACLAATPRVQKERGVNIP
jgi:site-specific DNA recombinase